MWIASKHSFCRFVSGIFDVGQKDDMFVPILAVHATRLHLTVCPIHGGPLMQAGQHHHRGRGHHPPDAADAQRDHELQEALDCAEVERRRVVAQQFPIGLAIPGMGNGVAARRRRVNVWPQACRAGSRGGSAAKPVHFVTMLANAIVMATMMQRWMRMVSVSMVLHHRQVGSRDPPRASPQGG